MTSCRSRQQPRRRPPPGILRAVLYGHAFNARRRPGAPGPDMRVIRAALDGLCTRLDGSPAAATTITRKRAAFHGALGYAVEAGLLPANPAREGEVAGTQSRRTNRSPLPTRRKSGRSWTRSRLPGRT